eukprot:CAMPEP_0173390334 /NCGR_PEP_ID=MMETSP1356-20130122/14514_1 /TAXON_ID=77927 ORGANISM="Hemiselmis virescens, Strain PCC157" /NCGR_SAMPLE_ID=MMETSP1356 /ASSEMBLY_ACC=CAM_ASM_000847 /LENGTH=290 /DNA_ID=CAMNT_0014347689 /DNA_START=211 /DNA_END=1079 /DNA_ORIENTATION=-
MASTTVNFNVPDSLRCITKSSPWTVPFAAGGISGVAAALVGQPFDTIKVRMQTGFKFAGAHPAGAFDCLRMTMKHEGPNALFKGLGPQLGSQFLATALLFGIQDKFLSCFSGLTGGSRNDLNLISSAGFCAGGVLAVITCPMELIKVGIQSAADIPVTRVRPSAAAVAAKPSSLELAVAVVRKVRAEHGLRGLYTGVGLTSLRCAVGNAAFFSTFELCSRLDKSQNPGVKRSHSKCALFGAIAGTSYWLVCYPIDLLKSQIQNKVVQDAETLKLSKASAQPMPWNVVARG